MNGGIDTRRVERRTKATAHVAVVSLLVTMLAMASSFVTPSIASTSQITITSSVGVPDRGDTSRAYDGNLATETYTTPAFTANFPAYLEFGFDSANVNRIRLYKDTYVGPHDLAIQYTTDTGDLTARSWTNVSGLTNGFKGTELLDATAVNSDGTVTGDAHDSPSEGWASLTFDMVQATGIRIAFSGSSSCCNHYHVYEFQALLDTPITIVGLDPTSPDGDNGWYRSPVHATVSTIGADETRCVLDPASPPSTFDDIPAGCDYAGTGADVTSDGSHTLYAASIDADNDESPVVSRTFAIDATAPGVSCDQATPTFTVGDTGADLSATVTDDTSLPVDTTVSQATDVSTGGAKAVSLTGFDNAGNSNSATCGYLVVYNVLGFDALDGTSWRPGSDIRATFALADINGNPIPDRDARALTRACRVRVRLDGQSPTCAKYNDHSNRFEFKKKTSHKTALGDHTVTLDVIDGSTILNTSSVIVHLVH